MMFDWDYDPERYPRMGQLLKKKRETEGDAGVFELIGTMFNFDFLGVDGQVIDRMLWSRIALRSPAPIVVNTHEEEKELLTLGERIELARMMYAYYRPKWEKQKAVVSIEYDPIHNYLDEWSDSSEGEESRQGSRSGTTTDTHNLSVNRTNTRTDNLQEEVSYGETNTRTDNLSQSRTYDEDVTQTDDLEKRTDYNVNEQRTDNLTESKTYGKTNTRTDNLTETKTFGGTSTRTDNTTQADSGASGSREHQVYGFNSTQYQNSEKDIFTGEGSNTRHNTGTVGTVNGGQDVKADTGTQQSVEGGTDGKTNTGTQVNAKTGYETEGTDGTTTTEKDGTESVANTGTQTNAKSGSDTVANTGTQTNQGVQMTTGTVQRSESKTDSESGTSSRDRSGIHTGNIGNLTSQKQIGEEIALWKWIFIEEIMADATTFLTLDVYC